MKNIMYVVGDKFYDFSKNHGVITMTNFMKMIQVSRIGNSTNSYYFLGFGLTKEQCVMVKEVISQRNIKDIHIIETPYQKEENCYAHKRLNENVMISKPIKINDQTFLSQLMIDERCADMSDHVTGQHIQGMVLIEAARQMMLSVTENYFLSEEERFQYYFILKSIHVDF